jgi:hypothetical protein
VIVGACGRRFVDRHNLVHVKAQSPKSKVQSSTARDFGLWTWQTLD